MDQEKLIDRGLSFQDHITAIVDEGALFEGKLTFEGTVRIGGRFKGEIFTHDTLIISESAFVDAQIEAGSVFIYGKVQGHIRAQTRVVISPPAVFRGTITTPSLQIEEGVVFEGASYMPNSVSP